ncbi:hypothetical protein HY008_01100 [Candidatus Woesebacteria bacterium]|nr:hypothetical protein [Candidatus Woesebacteria bacterium]
MRERLILGKAEKRCKGCKFAHAMALKGLSQRRPDPDQEAVIVCLAPVRPSTTVHKQMINPDGSVARMSLFVVYYPLTEACVLSPNPNQKGCYIARGAEEAEKVPNYIEISGEKIGNTNFDPLMGDINY